jgi:hypothetical protein
MRFIQRRSDMRDRDEFYGKKFGITGKRYSFGKFGFYYFDDGNSDGMISNRIYDGKGSLLTEISLLPDEYLGEAGIEEMDYIEESINQMIKYIFDYFSEARGQKEFDNTDKRIMTRLYYIVQPSLKKHELKTLLDTKSNKACRESAEVMFNSIRSFTELFKYDNINTISEHSIAPYFDSSSPLDDSHISISAEHYFDGTIDEISKRYKAKLDDAKRSGKSLLVSLAQGDMSINDFNAKEDVK